jgi:hypothetical protein
MVMGGEKKNQGETLPFLVISKRWHKSHFFTIVNWLCLADK